MKVSLRIFRFSRKVVYIITGTLLLSGAAGATALYIGRDKLLGPSTESLNGMECTSVQVTTIHKKDRFWIRKYIKTDAADGLTRVKTALRVAGAVFEKEHPDLVQVVVLDSKGPDKRAEIRGHAIGADVIFVADPERLAATADMPQFSATYTDAPASISGKFFGQKTVMPEEDIHHLVASLSEKSDCIDPLPEPGSEGAAAEGEGGAAKEGEKAAGKEPKGEGEAAKTEGEGAKPAAEGEKAAEGGEPVAEAGKSAPEGEKAAGAGEAEKPAEAKGWLDSAKSMVFGGGEAAKPEGEPSKAEKPAAEGKAAAEGEAAPAEGEKPVAKGETAAAEAETASAEGEKPAGSKGLVDSMKSMVFGGEEAAEPPSPFDAAAKSHMSGGESVGDAASAGQPAPAEEPAENAAAEGASSASGKDTPFTPVPLPGAGHGTKAKGGDAPQASAEEKPAKAKPHG